MTMQPRAYSYIRFSRPEQMRGDSLRRQMKKAEEWATARGVAIDETLKDLGVSGYRGKNRTEGALSKFLELVTAGRIARGSFLILESLDRMSREAVIDILPRFLDLINAGITVVTLLDKQEYSRERLKADWTPLIMSLAVMARSHEESKTKADRLLASWEKKRCSDKVMTAVIPGWLKVVQGSDGNRRIVEIPERVVIVRRIFAEILAGSGRRMTCARLNKEGVKPFGRSRGWQPSYIKKVLSSRTVLGELQTWSRAENGVRKPIGDPRSDYYPAIIDPATFARAQMAMRSRTHAGGRRGPQAANLLVGLVRCGSCGSRMQRLNKGEPPKGGVYFACSDATRGMTCDNRRKWRADIVEQEVIARLKNTDLERVLPPEQPEAINVADGLRARIVDAENRRSRWAKAFDDGDDFAADRIKGLRDELKALKRELAEAVQENAETASAEPPGVVLNRARELIDLLAVTEGDEAVDLRRRLAQTIRELVMVVQFHPEHVVARVKRRITKGMMVLPRYVDGKFVPEWEAEVRVIDERKFSDEGRHDRKIEDLHFQADIESMAASEPDQRLFRTRLRS